MPRLMKETINDLMIIKKAFMAGEKTRKANRRGNCSKF